MANITLVQYTGSTVTATDDALMYDTLAASSGLIHGGTLNFTTLNQVTIDSTFGLLKGRLFKIDAQTIYCDLPTGTGRGRIYVHMDLSNTDEPIQLLTEATTGELRPLVQNPDVNYVDGIYEMELGTYEATEISLTSVTKTAPTVEGTLALINALSARMGDTDISTIGDGTATGAISQINNDLTAQDNNNFRFRVEEGKYGYLKSDDTFVPFSNVTLCLHVSRDSSTVSVTYKNSDYFKDPVISENFQYVTEKIFNIPNDGFARCYGRIWANNTCDIYLNGIRLCQTKNTDSYGYGEYFIIPCRKNDILKFQFANTNNGTNNFDFYEW